MDSPPQDKDDTKSSPVTDVVDDNELKVILSTISREYPSSKVFKTMINDISDDKMVDTFHVIRMTSANKRPFDVCKDGFIYKRESSKKAFSLFFKKQSVAYYSCQGLLVCVNSDCPIFKRISHLNNVPMTDKSDKKCFHCPKDTEYEMVHDKCSS